jgi:hypothetical protein
MMLQRKWLEIATFLSIAALQFCFLSYWLMGVICNILQECPEAIQQPSGISQWLSYALFQQPPADVQFPLRAFPRGYWQIPSSFCPFSSKAAFLHFLI